MSTLALKPTAHIVDVLGNVIGRDQPILRMEKALEMVSLLGAEVFADENVVFFDPFCKAGELLLACAFLSCKAKSKTKLLDIDTVYKEIYESNRYFGLAPDERHHKLSVRTFLGNTKSHDTKFNHIIRDGHYLSEQDGRLDKDKFEKEFKSMIEYIKKTGNEKIIAVGNPPYQEADKGHSVGGAAKPVYNIFVESVMDHGDIHSCMLVIPDRWMAGGRNLDKFRKKIISSKQIKRIKYFSHSKEVFPTVEIDGGIIFFNWDRSYSGDLNLISTKTEAMVDLAELDIIPNDPMALPILNKVLNCSENFVSEVALSGKPFGLRTFHFDRNKEDQTVDSIYCWTQKKVKKKVSLAKIKKNVELILKWKVCVPSAYGATRTLPVNQYLLVPPNEIVLETYNVVNTFDYKSQAENFLIYLRTDFARYLLGLRKNSKHIPADKWKWLPLLDFSFIADEVFLVKKFKLTKDEILHIKKKVQEWS